MKKEYENPVLEIELIDNYDVITTSNYDNDGLFEPGKEVDPWQW